MLALYPRERVIPRCFDTITKSTEVGTWTFSSLWLFVPWSAWNENVEDGNKEYGVNLCLQRSHSLAALWFRLIGIIHVAVVFVLWTLTMFSPVYSGSSQINTFICRFKFHWRFALPWPAHTHAIRGKQSDACLIDPRRPWRKDGLFIAHKRRLGGLDKLPVSRTGGAPSEISQTSSVPKQP